MKTKTQVIKKRNDFLSDLQKQGGDDQFSIELLKLQISLLEWVLE